MGLLQSFRRAVREVILARPSAVLLVLRIGSYHRLLVESCLAQMDPDWQQKNVVVKANARFSLWYLHVALHIALELLCRRV